MREGNDTDRQHSNNCNCVSIMHKDEELVRSGTVISFFLVG